MPIWPRRVYLDNNATTPVAPEIRRAMTESLAKNFGNASSLHITGRTARGAVEQARVKVASLLGCEPDRVFFTSGGTEANNTVLKGVFTAAGGGHTITSRIEHDSTLGACRQIEERGGAVTYVPAQPDGRVRPEDVKAAIRRDTILISIMHANNETGAIQPVREIAAVAREAHVPFHTDAVQSYGKISTPVDEIGCEFLSLSAHKINGPKGSGALYWRGNTRWSPQNYGGDQERTLRAGTEGVHQIVGLGAAAELAAQRMQPEFDRQRELRKTLTEGIRNLCPQVQFNEAEEPNQLPGTVSATFPGMSGLSLLAGLDCYEVCVSIGSACTADRIEPSHVILGMGRDREYALSTIRISMGTTTTRSDLRYFLWALKKVLRGDPKGLAYMPPEHLNRDRVLSEDTFLIDLRMRYERLLSPSIPGAKLWSHVGFEKRFREIPRDKEVILMCTTGIFSFQAGYHLAMAGHPRVRVVYGGYAAWRALYPRLLEDLLSERRGASSR
jgi:cysteine desulfurase